MPTTLHSLITNNTLTLIRLPYSFVTIIGAEAEKFLQGQFTCDMVSLTNEAIQYGTVNSPKGRMYGLFKITRIENGFLIRLESSTVEHFLTMLNKYKVFFKCEIQTAKNISSYAFQPLNINEECLPQHSNQLRQTDTAFISRLSNEHDLFEIWSSDLNFAPPTTGNDPEDWFALETQIGLPELYAVTQDHFILQYLNLQELGAVSFKKGCYTGQEIIARMKFLGKLKKKMYLLSSSIKETVEAGSEIYDESGKKCGQVVRSHWSESTGSVALGILSTRYSDSADKVFLGLESQTPFTTSQITYNP